MNMFSFHGAAQRATTAAASRRAHKGSFRAGGWGWGPLRPLRACTPLYPTLELHSLRKAMLCYATTKCLGRRP